MHISETHRRIRAVASNATALADLVGDGTRKSGDPAAIERLRAQIAKDFAAVNTALSGSVEAS